MVSGIVQFVTVGINDTDVMTFVSKEFGQVKPNISSACNNNSHLSIYRGSNIHT